MRDITALGGVAVLTLIVAFAVHDLLLVGKRGAALFVLVAVLGGLALSQSLNTPIVGVAWVLVARAVRMLINPVLKTWARYMQRPKCANTCLTRSSSGSLAVCRRSTFAYSAPLTSLKGSPT